MNPTIVITVAQTTSYASKAWSCIGIAVACIIVAVVIVRLSLRNRNKMAVIALVPILAGVGFLGLGISYTFRSTTTPETPTSIRFQVRDAGYDATPATVNVLRDRFLSERTANEVSAITLTRKGKPVMCSARRAPGYKKPGDPIGVAFSCEKN